MTRPSTKALERAWTDFLDANPDGVTSPEEYPDHALVTFEQMTDIVRSAALDEAEERSAKFGFGQAIKEMVDGKRVARVGWNGNRMFAYYVPAASYPVQTGAAKAHFGEGAMVPYRAYLALKTADDDVATWAPSCSDVLAVDWFVVG